MWAAKATGSPGHPGGGPSCEKNLVSYVWLIFIESKDGDLDAAPQLGSYSGCFSCPSGNVRASRAQTLQRDQSNAILDLQYKSSQAFNHTKDHSKFILTKYAGFQTSNNVGCGLVWRPLPGACINYIPPPPRDDRYFDPHWSTILLKYGWLAFYFRKTRQSGGVHDVGV